jgi:serine/threonine-protein kinase
MRTLLLAFLLVGCGSNSTKGTTTNGGTNGGTNGSTNGGTNGSTTGSTGGMAGAGKGVFPSSAPWYTDVSSASLDAKSADVMTGLAMAGGWGNGNKIQIDFSIEVLSADASVQPRMFTQTGDFYSPDCDPAPMPVPPGGRLEGEANYHCASDGDCHLLVVQGKRLFEMWRADITDGTATGPFNGGCLAIWDLTKDYWVPAAPPNFSRGDQCTSADAAGYPISALLFSADEVKAGSIDHAIRFILPNNRIDPKEYVHPATHATTHSAIAATPVPYGARFRLKKSFDLTKLPSDGARVVATALQKYGMFLADGGNIALTAQNDTYTTAKWSGLLAPQDLSSLQVSDFEMVDGGARIPLTQDCMRTPLTQ